MPVSNWLEQSTGEDEYRNFWNRHENRPMPDLAAPYAHIRNALSAEDVDFLRDACKRHILKEGIPCYALVNDLESPTFINIKAAIENLIGEPSYYLNDFYIYTDSSFKTNWHMDTELFTFERALNAWILLSPDLVEDPLGFIADINESPAQTFHSVRIQGDKCSFGNYSSGEMTVRSLAAIEAEQIHTPAISVGDILVLDPKRFHRTNTQSSKHAISFKFVLRGPNGFLSTKQVDPHFWPEVAIFNGLVKKADSWENVIDGIRRALSSEATRTELSAGFYPGKFELYRRMVVSL